MTLPPERYLHQLRTDADALADLVAVTDVSVPVPTCPGWNLRDLVLHLGTIHRWAAHAVRTGEKPPKSVWEGAPADAEGPQLAGWYRHEATELQSALESCDPGAPTWHIFPTAMVSGVWHRRQAHETMVHVWDARHAVDAAGPSAAPLSTALDPIMASDGIDEYFEYMLPRRLMSGDGVVSPTEFDLHVHCTDIDHGDGGEWYVWTDTTGESPTVRMTREHKKAAAALRGRAEDLLLTLWRRPTSHPIDIVGSAAAADAWLAIGSV